MCDFCELTFTQTWSFSLLHFLSKKTPLLSLKTLFALSDYNTKVSLTLYSLLAFIIWLIRLSILDLSNFSISTQFLINQISKPVLFGNSQVTGFICKSISRSVIDRISSLLRICSEDDVRLSQRLMSRVPVLFRWPTYKIFLLLSFTSFWFQLLSLLLLKCDPKE